MILGKRITIDDVHNLCGLFRLSSAAITPLKERNRCVYNIRSHGREYILKVFDAADRSQDEIQGEIDFARICLQSGIHTYKPLHSIHDVALETLVLADGSPVYAFAYEKVIGYEVPESADAYQQFTPRMLFDWGQLTGRLHTLSDQLTIRGQSLNRPHWQAVNDLDYGRYIPISDHAIQTVFREITEQVQAFERTSSNYGLIHGDLHYGNFLITDTGLAVLDLDSSVYHHYAADIAITLYSLLPYPRYRQAERSAFAKTFFQHFLEGYATARSLPSDELDKIPHLMRLEDMANYIALYRHWDMDHLSKRQKRILMRNRYHILHGIPLY